MLGHDTFCKKVILNKFLRCIPNQVKEVVKKVKSGGKANAEEINLIVEYQKMEMERLEEKMKTLGLSQEETVSSSSEWIS